MPKLSDPVRNLFVDSINTTFDSGVLVFRTGTQPTNAGDAPVGTVIITMTIPSDSFSPAASGAIAKAGTWQDTSADNTGVPTWARMQQSSDLGTTNSTDERIDFTVGQGSGEISLNNSSIVAGQLVTLSSLTLTMPAT